MLAPFQAYQGHRSPTSWIFGSIAYQHGVLWLPQFYLFIDGHVIIMSQLLVVPSFAIFVDIYGLSVGSKYQLHVSIPSENPLKIPSLCQSARLSFGPSLHPSHSILHDPQSRLNWREAAGADVATMSYGLFLFSLLRHRVGASAQPVQERSGYRAR